MAKTSQSFFMYVLRCCDGTLYTGYTNAIQQRLTAHNEGRGAKYTAARRPVQLVASAEFPTKHQAMSAEFRFKRLTRPQKEALIAEVSEDKPLEDILSERFPLATKHSGS